MSADLALWDPYWDDARERDRSAFDRLTEVIASLNVSVTALADSQAAVAARLGDLETLQRELAQDIYFVPIPAIQGTVTAGGVLTIASVDQLGPKLGQVWDVRRISVTGLASSSETVTVWRTAVAAAVGAQAQNFVTTLTGPTAYLNCGLGAVTLRPNETLMVTGTGLTAGENVMLSGDAINIGQKWVGLYLL